MTTTDSVLGRAKRDGSSLFSDWFSDLNQAAESEKGAAYVFVMGSLCELLHAFDFPIVFPEINSLQTAVRHVAHEYLNDAEDYGYSPDICGYVKADVSVQLNKGRHPLGRIPKPSVAVLTNACNTYIKWAEIWERMHHIPVFTLDVPGNRGPDGGSQPGETDFENDRRYIEEQLKELIELCEQVSGSKFDMQKLREHMGYANRMSAAWTKILDLNQTSPAVFNALTDGTIYLGVSNGFRGTKQGAEYLEDLVEELQLKALKGIGTITNEQYRLGFVGVPCYPIFRRFNELFDEWGGVFVTSTYLWFASGGNNIGYQYDLTEPIASLAEGTLLSVRDAMDAMFYQDRIIPNMVKDFALDGVVYHPIKSCRTVSTGLADGRRVLLEEHGIPSLFLESDMMDRRVVSEAQMKNRVDAFFEGLESRRHHVGSK